MDITHQSNLMIQTQYDTTSWNNLDHGMTMQIIHPSISHYHHHLSSYTTSLNQTPPSSSSFSIIHDHKIRNPVVEDQKQEEKEKCSDNQEPKEEEEEEDLGATKEMMYKIAAMQPVDIDPATIQKPKRRNMRISDDPQSVAARRRRERISERIRILQRLVPGGTKMDTATMLDEAIRYVKFLKRHIHKLQSDQNIISSSSPSGEVLLEDYTIDHDHLKDGNYNWQVRPSNVLGNSMEP